MPPPPSPNPERNFADISLVVGLYYDIKCSNSDGIHSCRCSGNYCLTLSKQELGTLLLASVFWSGFLCEASNALPPWNNSFYCVKVGMPQELTTRNTCSTFTHDLYVRNDISQFIKWKEILLLRLEHLTKLHSEFEAEQRESLPWL